MTHSRRSKNAPNIDARFKDQFSVIVGDPRRRVDYMMIDADNSPEISRSIGVVDICGFAGDDGCGQDVIDYFFQLKRAYPPIEPVFMFMHELCDESSGAYKVLEESLKAHVDGRKKAKKSS